MISTYASKIPKKWRLILLSLIIFLILGQMWVLLDSSTPLDTVPLIEQEKEQEPIVLEKQTTLTGFKGFLSKLPPIQHKFSPEPAEYTQLRESRREAIKESFLFGWHGYKKYALGHDELKPLSNRSHDPFGGWGATMIDSLSTLLVMDLQDEFLKVMPHIGKIDFRVNENVSVFESIIRYLGGFLSAFELSDRNHDILIKKAERLAQELLPAFDTPSGLPHHLWNPVKNRSTGHDTLIAEVGTVQLEFMMLSQHTGDPIYGQKAQAITDLLDRMGYEHGVYIKGLYPITMDTRRGRFMDSTVSFGAMGDSAFEYFLKEYLLTDGTVPQYGKMYLQSIKSMKRYMLRQVPGHDLLLLPPYDTRSYSHRRAMDHLTCFVPGMLAMGAKTFDEPEDMEIAKALLETCVYMYRTTSTGLSPENWMISNTEPYNPLTFNKTEEQLDEMHEWWYEDNATIPRKQQQHVDQQKQEYMIDYQLPPPRERPESLVFGDRRYVLRPETLESLFILYRITGDQKYQEYGWEIYQSIETWCKTKSAYATVRNVDKPNLEDPERNQIDSMESFLFAETFKYLYLLFSPPDVISLDKFVFNTEAHPFIRKHWNWNKIL